MKKREEKRRLIEKRKELEKEELEKIREELKNL